MTPNINIIDLAEKHGQTSYRNRADTKHPAYGFTEEGLQAFAHALLAAAPQAVQPVVPVDMRLVPVEFVRGFGDLAHNYSLAAVAPDYYHGVERDAFSAAYKRCGNDLVKLREILTAAPAHPAEGVPVQAFKTKVYQALGIGSACNEDAVFVNIENARRRADCLSAIEREFFMVETPPDESEGDLEPGEECLLNWAHSPEQYVNQFAEALAATQPTEAARSVLAERARQIAAEGWTPEKDDAYNPGVLAEAGGIYALHAFDPLRAKEVPEGWPWSPGWWKPKDPRTNLVKAGALILAEIERIDRTYAAQQPKEPA